MDRQGLWLAALLALTLFTDLGAAQQEVAPMRFVGFFACQIAEPRAGPARDCRTVQPPDNSQLTVRPVPEASGIRLRLDWDTSQSAELAFRLATDPPLGAGPAVVGAGTTHRVAVEPGLVSAVTFSIVPVNLGHSPVTLVDAPFTVLADVEVEPAGPKALARKSAASGFPATSEDPEEQIWPGLGLGATGLGLAVIAFRTRTWFAWLMFSRLQPERLADHPRRALILDAVRVSGYVSASELRRNLGLARGSFDHHVCLLVQAGLLGQVQQANRDVLFWPAWPSPPEPIARTRHRVLGFVAGRGGATAQRIAEALSVSPRLVRYHLVALERHGLIRRRQDSDHATWWPA